MNSLPPVGSVGRPPPSRQESLPLARCQSVFSPAEGDMPCQLRDRMRGCTDQLEGVILEGGFKRRCDHHFHSTGASDRNTTTMMTLSMCLAISNCGPITCFSKGSSM